MSLKQGLDGGDFDTRDEFSVLPGSMSPAPAMPPPLVPQAPSVAPKLDPDRFRLLKKPLDTGLRAPEPTTPRWQK
jgi:hypothetical protein